MAALRAAWAAAPLSDLRESWASGDNSTAVGFYSTALGDNSVALGANSTADRDNTVSVGDVGSERQVTNVAAGTEGTDAVNLNQLNAVAATASAAAAAAQDTADQALDEPRVLEAAVAVVDAVDAEAVLVAHHHPRDIQIGRHQRSDFSGTQCRQTCQQRRQRGLAAGQLAQFGIKANQ